MKVPSKCYRQLKNIKQNTCELSATWQISSCRSRSANVLVGNCGQHTARSSTPSVEGPRPHRSLHWNRRRSPVVGGRENCLSVSGLHLKRRNCLWPYGLPRAPARQTRHCLLGPQPALARPTPPEPHRHVSGSHNLQCLSKEPHLSKQ